MTKNKTLVSATFVATAAMVLSACAAPVTQPTPDAATSPLTDFFTISQTSLSSTTLAACKISTMESSA